jgi:ParB family chromosome partitioning protein
MAQAKKGLGRGLSALIPTDDMDFLSSIARGDFALVPSAEEDAAPEDAAPETAAVAPKPSQEARVSSASQEKEDAPRSGAEGAQEREESAAPVIQWANPSAIEVNPFQPRRVFDVEELANLTDSVREHGVLQPIIVRPSPSASIERPFQLIAGERRWRAAQAAGLDRVPVVVREVSDQQALELAIIENVQRHDISPLDAALAYRRLASEFGLSQEKIAQRVGKSRPAVSNTIRLLELPEEAQQALQDGLLSEGHGRAILLASGEGARRAAFRTILRDKLTVRDAEELARKAARYNNSVPTGASEKSPARVNQAPTDGPAEDSMPTDDLIEVLQRALSCRVEVRPRRRGGQIVLHCSSQTEMTRIAEALQKSAARQS